MIELAFILTVLAFYLYLISFMFGMAPIPAGFDREDKGIRWVKVTHQLVEVERKDGMWVFKENEKEDE